MSYSRRCDINSFLVGIIFSISLFLSVLSLQTAATQGADSFPTQQNPLIVDSKNRRILIYTEVNEKGGRKTSTHFGVVFKDGKLADKALLKAYVSPVDFYDALLNIGVKPENNLTRDSRGKYVEGDSLEVMVTWPGLHKEIPLKDFLTDSGGKGFDMKFGGNRTASVVESSGCITCLESCWVGVTSNASYPMTSTLKRFFSPNSQFSINEKVHLLTGGEPVILIYSKKNLN